MEGNELTYFLDYGARIDNSLKDPKVSFFLGVSAAVLVQLL